MGRSRCKRWEFAALNEAACKPLNADTQGCSQDQSGCAHHGPQRRTGAGSRMPVRGLVQKLNAPGAKWPFVTWPTARRTASAEAFPTRGKPARLAVPGLVAASTTGASGCVLAKAVAAR